MNNNELYLGEYQQEKFIEYMTKKGISERTIHNYAQKVKYFFKIYNEMNRENIDEFFENISDRLSSNSHNCYVNAINAYIAYLELETKKNLSEWKHHCIAIKQVSFLDDILSMEDFEYFCNKAKEKGRDKTFIACKIMGTTGMRISEIINIQRRHIENGSIDFYGKGNKKRRVYFTDKLKLEVLEILDKHNLTNSEDYIICSSWCGDKQSWKDLRALSRSIAIIAEQYCGFRKGLVHPHIFRHFFAKNFIKKYQNIALLADLLGHSNLETTRIYLKFTSSEQKEIVNQVVTW